MWQTDGSRSHPPSFASPFTDDFCGPFWICEIIPKDLANALFASRIRISGMRMSGMDGLTTWWPGAIETKDTSVLLLNGKQNRGRPVSFYHGLMDLCTCANGTLLTFPVSPALSVCRARSLNNPVCEHSYLGDTTTIIFHLFCAHALTRAHIHQPLHSVSSTALLCVLASTSVS